MRFLGVVLAAAMSLSVSTPIAVAQARYDANVRTASDAIPASVRSRLNRRAACRQQAAARGLSGRMARRFTRLCRSGLPVPDLMRRAR
jgi:hypothetical protein